MRVLVPMLVVAMTGSAFADQSDPGTKPATKTRKTKPKPKADPPAVATPPGPNDTKVVAVLETIVAGHDPERTQAIADLQALALQPDVLESIGAWIVRVHPTAAADRRKVLGEIKASVPDKAGKFSTPARQSGKQLKADDELDWHKALLALDATKPGVGEVIADVAAIRALAATKDPRAARLVFEAAFSDQAMIYRDECGRYLRKMEAYAIPALTRESFAINEDRKRYATWQLERLDRQDANKALAAATGNEALQIAILDAFRDTHHREAVHAVWMFVDQDAPRVRVAARAAWMGYVTGPPPKPAPRKHLQMTGGKLSPFAVPLWLTYRELADNELRKAANELLHEDYPLKDQNPNQAAQDDAPPLDLEALTKRLFAYYDGERTKRDAAQWRAAKAKADGNDLAAATTMLDQLIATNPDRSERAEMATLYVAFGKQLEVAGNWAAAAAAYSKAHGLDPKQPTLAAVHFSLGKALEATGKDGGPDFRRAIALDPDYAPAKAAAHAADRGDAAGAKKPEWMLYAAIGAGALAMLLFGAAMMMRRRG